MERRAPWTEVCLLLKKECRSLLVLCIFLLFFLTAALSIPSFQPAVAATVPPIITYQGKLLESNNSVTTTKAMGFLIYDAATSGNLLYTAAGTLSSTSTINITPTQGIFSVDLGGSGTNALTTSTFANNHTLYLEVIVGSSVLSPRKRLTTVPFAVNAEYLMGLSVTSTSSSTYIPHADQFGNFLFTGNSRSTAVSGGLLYINPTSTITSGTLFGIAVNGQERFRVDASGNVFASGTITASGTINTLGNFAINSSSPNANFTVSGTVYISGTTTITDLINVPGRVTRPVTLGTYANSVVSSSSDIALQGDYIYVAAKGDALDSLDIVNISNPTSLRLISSTASTSLGTSMASPQAISVRGNYAYVVATVSKALNVIDISNPTVPKAIGKIVNGEGGTQINSPQDLAVQGNYAYISNWDANANGVEIVDISDPYNPRHAGLWNTTGLGVGTPTGLAVNGRYLFVTTRGDVPDATITGLYILDVSTPSAPRIVGSVLNESHNDIQLDDPRNIVVQGSFAYVTNEGGVDALNIIDISNPASPRFVTSTYNGGYGATFTLPRGLAVAGNYVYVGGLQGDREAIFDVSSSTNPQFVGQGLMANPGVLMIQGNYLYVQRSPAPTLFGVVDISGLRASNADIGSAKISTLEVFNPARFDQGVTIQGGVHIGNVGLFLGGDLSLSIPTSSLAATNTIRFAQRALFLASTTAEGPFFTFDTATTTASSTVNTIFSVRNNGAKLFSVSSNGQVHVLGSVYASSTAIGSPGLPGDLAERVDIAADDTVEPGDVMVVDPASPDTYRKSTVAYDATVAGVISGNPTIIVGNGKTDHTATLAMIGRVPVKVSNEGGPIVRGDLLVAASLPGHAMKHDRSQAPETNRPVGIIGVALDTFDAANTTGLIMALIRTGWVRNRGVQTELSVSETENSMIADSNPHPAVVDLQGGTLLNIARLIGINSRWEINERGELLSRVAVEGGSLTLYTPVSPTAELTLTGLGQLSEGEARIEFDALTREVIDAASPIIVIVTPTGEEGNAPLRVLRKDHTGFTVREIQGGGGNGRFDWTVAARKRTSADAANDSILPLPAPSDQVPVESPSSDPDVPHIELPQEEVLPESDTSSDSEAGTSTENPAGDELPSEPEREMAATPTASSETSPHEQPVESPPATEVPPDSSTPAPSPEAPTVVDQPAGDSSSIPSETGG